MTPLRPPGTTPAAEIGVGMARAEKERVEAVEPWTLDDTERWLRDYPLPATFKWNGTRAYPQYALKKGYGFWLRKAGQYYPPLRGLFALCHEILASLRPGIDAMPSGEDLAALLPKWRDRGELPLIAEDMETAKPGTPHPGENAPNFSNEST